MKKYIIIICCILLISCKTSSNNNTNNSNSEERIASKTIASNNDNNKNIDDNNSGTSTSLNNIPQDTISSSQKIDVDVDNENGSFVPSEEENEKQNISPTTKKNSISPVFVEAEKPPKNFIEIEDSIQTFKKNIKDKEPTDTTKNKETANNSPNSNSSDSEFFDDNSSDNSSDSESFDDNSSGSESFDDNSSGSESFDDNSSNPSNQAGDNSPNNNKNKSLNSEQKVAQKDIYEQWTDIYGNLLQKYVHEGSIRGVELNLVDYASINQDPDLQKARTILMNLPSFENKGKLFQLSMWINIYNFLTIYKVAKNKEISQFNDLEKNGVNVWKQPIGIAVGKPVTLDGIENQIIRKQFNEPRIHFALVCAAVGCPSLRNEPYIPATLDQTLTEQLNSYTKNKKSGLKISQRKIYMSQIFSWFASDFGGNSKKWLLQKRLLPQYASNYSVEYIPYDWTLNNSRFDDNKNEQYIVNQKASLLSIVTHKAGIAASLAHDHMIYASSFESKIKCNPQNLNSATFSATIFAKNLYVDLPSLQKTWFSTFQKMDIQTTAFSEVSESDRSTIRSNMLGSDQLDGDNYPRITTKVLKINDKRTVVGKITFNKEISLSISIKGKTVTKSIPGNIDIQNGILYIEATGEYKFTEFGITPYYALFGAIKNSDDFYLYVQIEAVPEK